MKIKNVIGRIVRRKSDSMSDKGAVRPVFLVFVVFVLFLASVLGGLYFGGRDNAGYKNADLPAGLQGCTIMQNDCSSEASCSLFSLCGSTDLKVCDIYDCGEEYGVYMLDSGGNVNTAKKAKYDKKLIQTKQDACGKSMEILQQKCENNQMQVTVKLSPTGECKIGSFTLIYDGNKLQENKFTALKGGNYLITADTCGKITQIIPRTEEGIAIF